MSNYTKTTNFATKDNLSPGNPLKIVKGTEIDTEYNNIATAIATKTDNSAAAITGGTIVGITDLAVADGGTGASTAAAALNNLLPSQTSNANKYLQTDGTNASWDAVSLSTADITGTLAVANGGTGVTTSTGTTNVVLSNSPTLVTPALGTPSAAVLTNATGLPLTTGVTGTLPVANGGTGITSFGTGVATFLGTPSSANLASAVTDETGSGALVFATSPTLVTPILGTPTSGTLTNATDLPISTGVSGLGTGVATFLATPSSANLLSALTDETGTGSAVFATSPTLVTPLLGTPTSGVATNLTGLPLTTGVTGLLPIANGGTATATPSIVAGTNITVTGTWPNQTIDASGGGGSPGGSTTQVQYNNAGAFGGITGATTNGTALTLVAPNLGTPASGTLTNATGLPLSTGVSGLGTGVATALAVNVGSAGAAVVNGGALGTPSSGTLTSATGLPLSTGVTGTLPVANGGTSLATLTANNVILGNGTSTPLFVAPSTSGNVLTSNGTTWASTAPTAASVTQIQTLAATVATNALTIAVANLSMDFRAATLASGVVSTVTVAPVNLVVPSGATLGTDYGLSARIIVGVMNNAGTAELFIVNSAGTLSIDLSESGLISTTVLDTASDSRNVAYSATARTNLPYRLVGFIVTTQTTPGVYATAPTTIQGYGGQVVETSKYTDTRVTATKWNMRTSNTTNVEWAAIAWSGTVFAAVAKTGLNCITSPDGIVWTTRTVPSSAPWRAIAWNGTIFCAVGGSGTASVMTSPDGITWTDQTAPANAIDWYAIAWNGTVFCAVGDGGANDVMTSPDGITWTMRTGAANNSWKAIAWSGTVFACVSSNGTGNRVMTSPDGITWTSRTSAADISWQGVAWGGTLFAAVAASGTGNRVMTSPDGITWTIRVSAADNNWLDIAWNGTVFAAVSPTGTANRVMTSFDGVTWMTRVPGADIGWEGIAWNGTVFAAVGGGVPGIVLERVMTTA